MDEKEYFQHQIDSLTDGVSIEHQDGCGQCHKQRIVAKIARRMVRWSRPSLVSLYAIQARIWVRSKYFRYIDAKLKAGWDVEQAIGAMRQEKGWEA